MSRFEIGDEVVLARSYFAESYCYFYGHMINDYPLQSEGQVYDIFGPEVHVKIIDRNGFSFEKKFHEFELEFVPFEKVLEKKLPNFKDIGKHPLFELAENNDIVVFGKKIYAPNMCALNNLTGTVNYIENIGDGAKQKLEEIGGLHQFDDLFYGREEMKIEELEKKYAENIGKQMLDENGLNLDLSVPELIVNQVFPYLRSDSYEKKLANLVDEGFGQNKTAESGKLKIIYDEGSRRTVENVLKEKKRLIEKIGNETLPCDKGLEKKAKGFFRQMLGRLARFYNFAVPKENESLIAQALEDKNAGFFSGKLYYAVPCNENNKASGSKVLSVHGKKSYLVPAKESISTLEDRCRLLLSKKIRTGAVKKYLSEEKIKQAVESNRSLALKYLGGYEEEDFGFAKYGDAYYVYLKLPELAVRDITTGEYYSFGKTKVAVEVVKKGDGSLTHRTAAMIENNNHPLFVGRIKFMSLCSGSNDIPLGRDAGETIANHLRRYREIILYGYKNYGFSSEGRYVYNRLRSKFSLLRFAKPEIVIIDGGQKK